jgi:hypothetical protein
VLELKSTAVCGVEVCGKLFAEASVVSRLENNYCERSVVIMDAGGDETSKQHQSHVWIGFSYPINFLSSL